MYVVKVYVTGKESVLDPQGSGVKKALQYLNYKDVTDVRVGKYIELTLDGLSPGEDVNSYIESMCEKVLANTVVEDYSYKIEKAEESKSL